LIEKLRARRHNSPVKNILIALLCIASVELCAQNSPVKRPSNPGVTLDKALVLYGELSERTVLRHPSLMANQLFVYNSATTNHAEIIQHLEAAFAEKEIAVIPDGGKFVLIGPKSQQAALVPGATNIAPTTTKLYPKGSIHFVNVTVGQVMTIYADLIGKKLAQGDPLPPMMFVAMIQTSELTREECLYAFETLLRWQGWRLVPSGTDAIKPMQVSREPDGQTKK